MHILFDVKDANIKVIMLRVNLHVNLPMLITIHKSWYKLFLFYKQQTICTRVTQVLFWQIIDSVKLAVVQPHQTTHLNRITFTDESCFHSQLKCFIVLCSPAVVFRLGCEFSFLFCELWADQVNLHKWTKHPWGLPFHVIYCNHWKRCQGCFQTRLNHHYLTRHLNAQIRLLYLALLCCSALTSDAEFLLSVSSWGRQIQLNYGLPYWPLNPRACQ